MSGQMVMCLKCGETYWSEDGHPEGTECQNYEIKAREKPGKIECKIHPGTWYWHEDVCPECEAANPE